MADQLLYEVSNSTDMGGEPFVRRENVYIIDQNNGSYTNNQILMDCASVSNSGKWADFANAYIQVPIIHTLSSAVNFSAVDCDFAQGLKNGFHQIVSSLNVEYNNSSVVQISNLTNMYISYKLNTTLCLDDIATIGNQIGFFPDSALSWKYHTAVSVDGVGSCNNRQTPALGLAGFDASFNGTAGNLGFSQRQLQTTFRNTQTGVTDLLGAGTAWASVSSTFARPVTSGVAVSGGVYYKLWTFIATLRLKDLSDFFAQLPLVRNAYMKIYVNINQSVTKWNVDTHELSVIAGGINIFGGNTNPLMIASGFTTMGSVELPDGDYTSSVSVLTTLDSSIPSNLGKNSMLSSCRLYIDLYTMNPLKEEQYLLSRTKTIKYRDLFSYQFLNVSNNFNFLVTNGISNLKEVVVCPLISSTANLVGNGIYASPIASPFGSEPATLSPLMYINNFNMQISGVNIFNDNENFGFQQFLNELYGVGSINGGLTDGLSSGLISQTAFYNNYGYLVANTARRLPEEDRTPKSLQISGTILNAVALDLFIFCVFEKEIVIDTYTGKRVL